jgi:anti-sigma factor (TIGR02949 family)
MTRDTDASLVMDCAELARALDAFLDGELAAPERADAARHLASCDRCRRLAEAEGWLREAVRSSLRDAAGVVAAPEDLRARIQTALGRQRRAPVRHFLSARALAALGACGLGALLMLLWTARPDPLVADAVRKHARDLPLELSSSDADPAAVARWFSGRLEFAATPPAHLGGPGAHLAGARLSHLLDRPAAYVRYDLPRGRVGLFILDDPDRRFRHPPSGVLSREPAAVEMLRSGTFHVALWREGEVVYSLVSDLDEAEVRRLAESARAARSSDRR